MVTTWTNILNGAATTVGATPGDAVPASALADVLQISNSGTGLDTTLRDVRDGDGDTIPMQVSTSAVMLPHAAIWPYGDSTFFSAGQTGILIPFYVYPNNPYSDATCTRLLGLIRQYRGRVPVIVVLNPGSGPGSVMDGNYSAFIKLIQAAGGKVAGYVSTAYAGTINPDRTEAAVKADVDTWLTLYADTLIDTVFFDEMNYSLGTNNEYVALYKRYTDYCHARNLAPVIANPGTNQQGAWFAERTADIIVVAETGTWPTESDMLGAYVGGHIDYKTSLRAALVYGQGSLTPSDLRTLARYVQWVYVTDDALSPNPWDSLSTLLEQQMAILADTPGIGLPVGGTSGQVLSKTGSGDFATAWTSGLSDAPADGTYYVRRDNNWYAAYTGIDFPFFFPGKPTNGQTIARVVMTRSVFLPFTLTGSRASAGTAATGSTTFSLRKNGVQFGTVLWSAAGTVGTITGASGSSLAAGDVLSVVAPNPVDATLADISISLTGDRT